VNVHIRPDFRQRTDHVAFIPHCARRHEQPARVQAGSNRTLDPLDPRLQPKIPARRRLVHGVVDDHHVGAPADDRSAGPDERQAAGVHPKVVQERLGHANIGITLSRYSHVIPSLHDDAASRIASLVYG
jgi:integrase